MRSLTVHRIAPGATLQDAGRPGYLAYGLSRGGAMDRLALAEGAALLQQDANLAALELPGAGGVFEATTDLRVALTGAPMKASIDGAPVAWHAVHYLHAGAKLDIGRTEAGSFGYLHVGGGFAVPPVLGARSAHLAAGVGAPVTAGGVLPVGEDDGQTTGVFLPVEDRFHGGEIRVVESFQTALFDTETLERFTRTEFHRDPRSNRMGAKLNFDGAGFHASGGLNILSDVIATGDIQATGDGTPYLLLAESQTTGGYPRLATVIPADLPRAVQAPAGAPLRFRMVGRDEALDAERRFRHHVASLPGQLQPLVRNVASIRDLLSYQLVSGVVAGDED